MTWDEKCWGIFENIYWEMRLAGVQGFKLTSQLVDQLREQRVPVPKGDRIYVRIDIDADNKKKLLSQEVVLNHFFNIAFAIAGDEVVSRLLCQPLDINDRGPFASFSSGFQTRYGWGRNDNVTQPDAFFHTEDSLICIELKLGSRTWPEQIAKYMALMHLEEQTSGKRKNLGLLFIVPESIHETHLAKVGVNGPTLGTEFIDRLNHDKLPTRIRDLFEKNREQVDSVRGRLRLASVSWTSFRDELKQIELSLDCSNPGDQTLWRLLSGLRAEIECHEKTGITKADAHSSAT